MRTAEPIDCFEQFQRARNTPDRLGRNSHSSGCKIFRSSMPAIKELSNRQK
jgi:hypothetical protein